MGEQEDGPQDPRPPLFLVKGEATPEEVAALTAVLTALGNAGGERPARPTPVWAAPQRAVRGPHLHGPGGWRASSLPR
ncbi:MAG: acyl-CoA carboxylase subunit epsilon [Nocardioides sp.]|nr:acyl-CoA carboxylase subunit epsilon [Nocardioides sp.]